MGGFNGIGSRGGIGRELNLIAKNAFWKFAKRIKSGNCIG